MYPIGSIQEEVIVNKSLRFFLSAFILLSVNFGEMPVHSIQAATTWTVTKAADTDDGTCNSDCSLREAIMAAGVGDTIVFKSNQTITLRSQLPSVDRKITIKGRGATNTIIQASACNPVTLSSGCTPATYRVLAVVSNGNLTLDGVTIRHGNCDYLCDLAGVNGGGIYNSGTLSMKNSAVSHNSTYYTGGGIYNDANGTLTVTNSTISGNSTDFGGGLDNGGTVTITNSTFSANRANLGGGIWNSSGQTLATLTVTKSTFLANSSNEDGGGIYNRDGGALTVNSSTISVNRSYKDGGGIYNIGALTVTKSIFHRNSSEDSDGAGGGIYNDGTTELTVTNSSFSDNSAYSGGGIHNIGTLTVTNSTFSANSATAYGGGIYNSYTLYVTDGTFTTNSAESYGGGIFNGSTLYMTDSTFSGNIAPNDAGISNGGEQYLTNTYPDN
jgi:CSLREA domain-containing protein